MNIVVCVKQVPDTTEVKVDPQNHTLVRQGIPAIVSPFDKNALEEALKLREKHGGKVTVISMGPNQADAALKECLSIGADDAVLISDAAFSGADTLATARTLAAAIRKLGKVDMILCGKQAIDGDTAQVGPELAEQLGIAVVTYVAKIEVDGNVVTIQREHEEGYMVLETKLPVLATVVKSINVPRLATIKGRMKANKTQIAVWTANDIDIDSSLIGLNGSPTRVHRVFAPPQRSQGEMIEGTTTRDTVNKLLGKLTDAKLI
ncbi:electron transfer flavoprotein subunit beta/FixA family protein [Sporomusa acidovorans]|uniref:Electron transfer flavoprotein small subunit n=1 Tax=Sporomusa acidovorans (strain ATCC 49682 / DSM 3132 / Mol) TaxID=1123286 RepID=A0ABZ3J0I7_SPOA4|nr:electron transfer flavoprotein subunit beta/FixA family protein [Sporomusa acidovorans]OZC13375.1 acryloyl-CoA reductase electron transfer subunit gamma [Sporomusa acidovorans DSM 3132]SDF53477.1 electron transfer flavoprotein beta subunit [Sporomusa acidovorans]